MTNPINSAPRRSGLTVPGMQPATLAQGMATSKSRAASLRSTALRTTRVNNGKMRCAEQNREPRGNGPVATVVVASSPEILRAERHVAEARRIVGRQRRTIERIKA
jgi:hypothetical protein